MGTPSDQRFFSSLMIAADGAGRVSFQTPSSAAESGDQFPLHNASAVISAPPSVTPASDETSFWGATRRMAEAAVDFPSSVTSMSLCRSRLRMVTYMEPSADAVA